MEMNPARQGDYDGTCGFYSVGNALSLLFPSIEIDEIFNTIFSYHIKKYGDAYSLIKGIPRGRLNEILKGTQKRLKLECSIYRPYWKKPASSLKDLHQTLLDYQIGPGRVAIMSYEYSDKSSHFSHWIVLRKVTEKSLLTHDSSGWSKRIPLSKCRLWDNKSRHQYSKPYRLSSQIFLLSPIPK